MLQLDAKQTRDALPWRALVDKLRWAFQQDVHAPLRHHHKVAIPGETPADLLLMPAWRSGEYLGLKLAMVIPDNHTRGLSSVAASYQLYDATSGAMLAVIDGAALTNRRTAAASALAADLLSNKEAQNFLMIGAGGLAAELVAAHSAVRTYRTRKIWARRPEQAFKLVENLNQQGLSCEVADSDLAKECTNSDVISCATLSCEPLVKGDWLKQGAHVDLVGAFTATMRESDDTLIQKSELFIDTFGGALSEAGDILCAINSGAITEDHIQADLTQLCSKTHSGRSSDQAITVFKSVGTALEDLAGAELAYKSVSS